MASFFSPEEQAHLYSHDIHHHKVVNSHVSHPLCYQPRCAINTWYMILNKDFRFGADETSIQGF